MLALPFPVCTYIYDIRSYLAGSVLIFCVAALAATCSALVVTAYVTLCFK